MCPSAATGCTGGRRRSSSSPSTCSTPGPGTSFGSNAVEPGGIPTARVPQRRAGDPLRAPRRAVPRGVSIQELFLPYRTFIQFWNTYYGTAHFIVTLAVFALLFWKRPGVFPVWRNSLAIMTGLAIVGFALFPLMPPRLLDEPCDEYGGQCIESDLRGTRGTFGYVDTLAEYGGPWSFDSDTMTGHLQPVRGDAEHAHRVVDVVRGGDVAAAAAAVAAGRRVPVPAGHAVLHHRHGEPLLDRRSSAGWSASPSARSPAGACTAGTSAASTASTSRRSASPCTPTPTPSPAGTAPGCLAVGSEPWFVSARVSVRCTLRTTPAPVVARGPPVTPGR